MTAAPTEPEQLLPSAILNLASQRGHEYAWKPWDIPNVFRAAQQAGLAILGGQLQFRAPNATCELYWIEFNAKNKLEAELWSDYVDRSFAECSAQFQYLVQQYDFEAEGVRAFSILAEMRASGVNINEYQCFVVYVESELSYTAR